MLKKFFFDDIVIHGTAGCYPFTDRDPFLIESCPHVYFVGNQDKYETRLMKGIFLFKIDGFSTLVAFLVELNIICRFN